MLTLWWHCVWSMFSQQMGQGHGVWKIHLRWRGIFMDCLRTLEMYEKSSKGCNNNWKTGLGVLHGLRLFWGFSLGVSHSWNHCPWLVPFSCQLSRGWGGMIPFLLLKNNPNSYPWSIQAPVRPSLVGREHLFVSLFICLFNL